MSGMSGVDLDRLADYAAGLLDPTEAAEVADLVASEPAWAETLAALTAAQPRVQAALAELAAPPIPDDVVARLEAALPQPDRGAEVVDLAAQRRQRRRWPRIAAGVTAAAAAAAVTVGGLNLLHSNSMSGSSATSGGFSADRNAGAASAPRAATDGRLVILATGTDYTPKTVTSLAGRSHPQAETNPGPLMPSPLSNGDKAAASGSALGRLADPAALQTCLDLLAKASSRTPTTVDYARYEGRPAVVVVLSGSGTGEVVVVGPDCGLPAAGADQIYAAPLR